MTPESTRTVYWLCHESTCRDEDKAFVRRALDDLSRWLVSSVALRVDFCALEGASAAKVDQLLSEGKGFADFDLGIHKELKSLHKDSLGDMNPPSLFVFCPDAHELKRMLQSKAPLAKWGLASRERWAACWGPPNVRYYKPILWHEALHLVGLDDCYDKNDQGKCPGDPSCLMEYVPCAAPTPVLCAKQLEQLKRLSRSD